MSENSFTNIEFIPSYGDLTELNTCRLILDSVGKKNLEEIARNYIDLLGSSGAIYEQNGDYALGIFSSGWCRYLDNASRQLCDTNDNAEALKSGKWLCHESCWQRASRQAIKSCSHVDIECHGGINLYAVPVIVEGQAIGSLNIGYGDPPETPDKLKQIADLYQVDTATLTRLAKEYVPRNDEMIDAAKKQLGISALLIGQLIENKLIADKHRKSLLFHESLERIENAMRREKDIQQMLWAAVESIFNEFACDRAWLLYPCDPDSPSFRIPIEITRPEYPGAKELNLEVPMAPGQAQDMRDALAAKKPVAYTTGSAKPTSKETADQFGVQAQMFTVVYPKLGKPWLLGMHQCSYPRYWKDSEQKLFNEITRRIEDTLSNLQFLNNLQESETKFRELAETIQEVFWVGSPDWSAVYYVSPAYEDIWGRSCRSLYNNPMSWLDGVHKDDRQLVQDVIANKSSDYDEQAMFPDYRVVRPDGSIRWISARAYPIFDKDGKIIRITGIAEDITARKDAEQALKRSETRFKAFFDHSPAAMYETDSRGQYILVNRKWRQFAGVAGEEAKGDGWQKGLHPDDRNKVGRLWRDYVDKQQPWDTEYRFRTPDGTIKWVWATAISLTDEEDKISGYLGLNIDISNRKLAEEEKERLQEHLAQAVKMQAIGTLAGGIAHEFNNLLSVIMGCTEMARDELQGESFAKDQLDQVMEASLRVKDLVKQILTFSRKAQQRKIPANLSQLLKDSLKLVLSSLPSSVTITEHLDPHCGNTIVDPTEIQQIIMNLSSNAVWAMQEKGSISIGLQQVYVNDQKAAELNIKRGEYLELVFSDSGCGMSEETCLQIFDPFFTQKEVGEGTGMGLSIVFGIMESYGGKITVASSIDKGTTFYLYFPVSNETTAAVAEKEKDLPKGTARILLVDDEVQYARMAKIMMSRLGYDVVLKTNSIEALRVFTDSPDSFDLVYTDQIMPELSGIELVRRIRSIRPDIRVILSTGFSSQIDEKKAKFFGIDGFAYKPISKKEIAVLIHEVLDKD